MPDKTFVSCPHCGSQLHPDASFCPYCARTVNERQELSPPALSWRRALRRALPILAVLLLLAAAGTGWYLSTRPQVYDDGGTGEVIYTDEDGTYQILLGWRNTPYEPAPVITQTAEQDEEYTFPVCLFIHHKDTGANAGGIFLRKVASVTAEFDTPDDPSGYIAYDPPAYDDYAPDAALTSFTHFLGRENSARGIWTITMDNGDVILLHQTLNVDLIETVDIYPEDAPMDTIEDLQTLVDSIEDQVGDHDGVGVTAAQRTWTIGCTFTGWRTALMCHGTGADGGICYTECRFEGNEVAVHYNTNQTNFFNSVAPDNQFLRNGTAILIEGEPVDQAMGLPGCRFEGNGTDIDNRSGQPLDISQAAFQ